MRRELSRFWCRCFLGGRHGKFIFLSRSFAVYPAWMANLSSLFLVCVSDAKALTPFRSEILTSGVWFKVRG